MGLGSKFVRVGLVALMAFAAHAQERHYRALVIGNGKYPQKPLGWPAADARAVAARLTELGYEVTTLQNTTSQQLVEALTRLRRSIHAGDVVLFYYAGRATRARDVSSLVPVDDTGLSRIVGGHPGVPLAGVIDMLEHSRASAGVVVMDVAAEWPVFGLDIGKEWLAAIPPPTARTVIVSGNGQGSGSVTAKLLQALQHPADPVAHLYAELGGSRNGWQGPRIPRAPTPAVQETPSGSEAPAPPTPPPAQQPAATPSPADPTPDKVPPPAARFATIAAPAQVATGVPFTVLVSLTADRRTPEVVIAQVGPGTGKTADGALDVGLPCQSKCEFEVVLAGPGFDFGTSSNTVGIEMSDGGDSTPARFNLRALRPGAGKLEATFWYQGAFLAQAMRVIQIVSREGNPGAAAGSAPINGVEPDLNGGRDRTRTCDLLRVKQAL